MDYEDDIMACVIYLWTYKDFFFFCFKCQPEYNGKKVMGKEKRKNLNLVKKIT